MKKIEVVRAWVSKKEYSIFLGMLQNPNVEIVKSDINSMRVYGFASDNLESIPVVIIPASDYDAMKAENERLREANNKLVDACEFAAIALENKDNYRFYGVEAIDKLKAAVDAVKDG